MLTEFSLSALGVRCPAAEALTERRLRLMDLSWLLHCFDEHIARKANAEDDVTGRFWEGRERALRRHDDGALKRPRQEAEGRPVGERRTREPYGIQVPGA
jgi:hypothetical protein